MLRTLFCATAAATAALAAIATLPADAAQRRSGEDELARATAGRVAGEPVDCIDLRSIRNQHVIPRTAIVYEVGDTIYVNRPRSGAQSLSQWDTQVVRPFGNRLCSIDVINVVDPATRTYTGSVFLDQFVPYRRVGAGR